MKLVYLNKEEYFSRDPQPLDMCIFFQKGDDIEVVQDEFGVTWISTGKKRFSTSVQDVTLVFVVRETES